MSSLFGKNIQVSLFGESHSAAVGVVIDRQPAGFALDMGAVAAFLARRRPGGRAYATARAEADVPEILSGFVDAAKAREAAESAAKSAADADRAAVSPQGQAAISAKKAENLAHEAQALADDLARAIEANRAKPPTEGGAHGGEAAQPPAEGGVRGGEAAQPPAEGGVRGGEAAPSLVKEAPPLPFPPSQSAPRPFAPRPRPQPRTHSPRRTPPTPSAPGNPPGPSSRSATPRTRRSAPPRPPKTPRRAKPAGTAAPPMAR